MRGGLASLGGGLDRGGGGFGFRNGSSRREGVAEEFFGGDGVGEGDEFDVAVHAEAGAGLSCGSGLR